MTRRKFVWTRLRGAKGTALLETALTLPLLLLVSMSIFEFGRAYETWEILTNASREGARVAILPGSDIATVQTRVVEYMNAGKLDNVGNAAVSVTPTTVSNGTGTAPATQVSIAYPFKFIALQPVARLLIKNSTLGAPLTITASAVMRNE